MEIYRLKIVFPYDEDEVKWSKTVDVKENFTLYELHSFIQDLVEFDDDHLWEFYVGKNPRNRSHSIPKKCSLNQVFPLQGYKLYYLFDFGDSWLFEIKKLRKKLVEDSNVNYPILVESTGVNPQQYPEYEDY